MSSTQTPQYSKFKGIPVKQVHKTVMANAELVHKIKQWGLDLGFADVGITHADLSEYEAGYFNWIGNNFHGEMEYMSRHGTKRTRPNELEPGTISLVSVRLNYFDINSKAATEQLHQPQQAYISRYALGKDYHKLLRKRLQTLAEKIAHEVDGFKFRAFTDSAPVLERPIAEKAGLGFTGKNSLIIHPRAGSWFFLGELYTNLQLPADPPFIKQGCGPCTACIQECPTQAILDNQVVDARRCISYLTIEFKGVIPLDFREKIGNRIYGCDDCQLVCPWNKFTENTHEPSFQAEQNKNALDQQSLLDLWQWSEQVFLDRLQGSPIRRIGYPQWTRNLAISLGNIVSPRPNEKLPKSDRSDITELNINNDESINLDKVINALKTKLSTINPMVDEHILWALKQIEQYKIRTLRTSLTRPSYLKTQVFNNKKIALKPFIVHKYYLPKVPTKPKKSDQ